MRAIGVAAVFMVLITASAAGLWLNSVGRQQLFASNAKDVPVAAIFYQWYGYEHDHLNNWPATGGLGTFHWNDIVADQLITGFVLNRPEIGHYPSDDDETIAWQLKKMEEAGIDTIIVSWWGWGDSNLDGNPDWFDAEQRGEGDGYGYIEQRSHDALIRLLEYIRAHDLGFKVALMVEPWADVVNPIGGIGPQPGIAKKLADDQKKLIFDYVSANIYDQYTDLIFYWEGKPLLAAAGELHFKPEDDSPDDRFTFRSFRLKEADLDPGNAWDWDITKPLPYFQEVDNTVILSPRYDEWLLCMAHPDWWVKRAWGRTKAVRHDPQLTDNLYDYQWDRVHEQRDEVDLIIIWAWNSWMEQLYIEPDDGQGVAPAGDSLLRKTAWYGKRFREGAAFEPFSPGLQVSIDPRPIMVDCCSLVRPEDSLGPPGPPPSSDAAQPDEVQLGVALSLWYGHEIGTGRSVGGLGSDHWNSGVIANREIHDPVAVTPELGFYSSPDPEVIATQVSQMEEIGVTWIATHWWGWGDGNGGTPFDDNNENDDKMRKAIDDAHDALFQHLETRGGDIQAFIAMDNWMIHHELWDRGCGVEKIGPQRSQVIWDRIYEYYVQKYESSYFHWQGKPLVVSWAPHRLHSDKEERFTYKSMWPLTFSDGRDGGYMDWSWLSPIADVKHYDEIIISPDGMVKVDARFDQYWGWLLGYLPGTPHRLDPFLKDGVYDKNWELVYEAMEEDENQVKLILIGTWNDYHEQSQIEPSYNGPLGTGHLLLDKTKHYWFRLKDGQPYEEYPKPWTVPIAPPDK